MTVVLVTGGAGYIGSHACKALAEAGYTPVSCDNLVHGHRWAVKWGPLEVGDIADADFLAAAFARHRPAAIMHFAAFTYVGESVNDPAKYYRNNVVGALSLLDAMRADKVDNIVFSSSCATYGVPDRTPIAESCPQNPVNPYGMSKLMVERILVDFGAAYGLRSASLRYFNACGADPDGEIGEDHDPETHLIPRALMAAAGDIPHLEIFGTDHPTPDGTCVRDYVHVADLADAHVKTLGYLLNGGETTAFNLGVGHGYSVREVLTAVERVTERALPIRDVARRPGDPPSLVADPGSARSVIGFSPQFTGIDDMVRTAWRWYPRRPDPAAQGT